ncbi:MAG: 6-phosphofructokinase [Clostridiaceae bacterium]
MKLEGIAVVAQGGGPTVVINESLVGVVLELRKFPQIKKVYGAINGVEGIINENFIDLSEETPDHLERVAVTPSSALLSTRVKPDHAYCQEIFRIFKAHDVRYFFYIGGNDSADTVRIVNEEAHRSNYEFRAIHIPKTIDNDLVINDHTPGYGSAARFVAQSFIGLNLDNRSLPGVHLGVVMGRNSGFLTAASSIAQKYPDDGPHLIYLPERTFKVNEFLTDVKRVYDQYGRCLIAVSEGIRDENGIPILTKLGQREEDSHGNVSLSGTGALGDLLTSHIKEKLHINRVRTDTFGYLQRSFIGCVSDVDQREAREVGVKAAQYALSDNVDGSVTIHRRGLFTVSYKLSDLNEIAAKTKLMPDEYICTEGNNVTKAFKDYLTPLLGSNMPTATLLEARRVEKILHP